LKNGALVYKKAYKPLEKNMKDFEAGAGGFHSF